GRHDRRDAGPTPQILGGRSLVAPAPVGAASVAAAAAAAHAPTATSVAAAAATTAAATLLPRLGLADGQGPAAAIRALGGVDGLRGLTVIVHADEPEAARPAGLPVGNHLGASHLAVLLKQGQQIVGGRGPDQVADVNILRHHRTFRCGCRARPRLDAGVGN